MNTARNSLPPSPLPEPSQTRKYILYLKLVISYHLVSPSARSTVSSPRKSLYVVMLRICVNQCCCGLKWCPASRQGFGLLCEAGQGKFDCVHPILLPSRRQAVRRHRIPPAPGVGKHCLRSGRPARTGLGSLGLHGG